ncbi:DNA adenine methylase [Nosocomiicoccus massiliensis]|uniref:Site-specific DNA-methyltransferase (adenine-specific) n=1 Tax=Nosocomiicoccus massiliensis TaxID=1232430 RepID=A0AAF0YKY4_9STAP|nr:DNA adenine methylase [Nosocomiicoccus massiliensis]WOS96267.1 DNA adenine methylase [Nosocomiicoccus massiliensis]
MYQKNLFLKPFIKWVGGKRQLLDVITSNLPKEFNHYYEPFIGGGAVFFELQHTPSLINDYNTELVNVYETIRDNIDELVEELKIHDAKNSKDYYLEVRAWDRTDNYLNRTNVERAARFIYMNKTGFNGLYRVNKKNQFNVPYGKYVNPNIVNEGLLREVSEFLNEDGIRITAGDFEEAVKDAKAGDFIYFNPPYAPLDVDLNNFVGYTDNGFGYDEQLRLRDLFVELDERGCYVMLSNSSSEIIHELYKDYKETTLIVGATRAVNSVATGRGKVDEVIVKNY